MWSFTSTSLICIHGVVFKHKLSRGSSVSIVMTGVCFQQRLEFVVTSVSTCSGDHLASYPQDTVTLSRR